MDGILHKAAYQLTVDATLACSESPSGIAVAHHSVPIEKGSLALPKG